MFMDNLYLSNYSYIYKSTNKNVTTNHGVTIIGWDDNYSTSNFSGRFKPSKNGAWIVQNSYGTSFGDNGIFYISYEDDEICTNIFSIRNIDPYITDNRYITSEQRALSTTDLTTQMSVFNKKSSVDEYLTKVSFEVMKPTNYKVYYYAGDAKKDNVKTSKMKLIASGSVGYTGWISVVPSKSITIPKSVKKYSIAVYQSNKLTGLARNIQKVYNSYENKTKNYYSPEKYKKNVSFVYDYGKWRDTYSYFSGNNYKTTINSFTDNIYVNFNSASVKYSYNDYFDVSYSIKALMNGKITSVRLIKDNNVIA
jgi:hypothetical protein